jgi:Protein of unknown function (DUF3592)
MSPVIYTVMLRPAKLIPLAAIIYFGVVVIRGIWQRRGSGEWPIVDGTFVTVTVLRAGPPASSGLEYQALAEYEFSDAAGRRRKGQWTSRGFPSEARAKDFINREMPQGKTVAVKYSPDDAKMNNLELDSWTYTDDRPLDLGV